MDIKTLKLDVDNHIEVSFDSSVYSIEENLQSNRRLVLGYISGTYNFESEDQVYTTVYYKRDNELRWESTTFQLDKEDKRFYQKLPPGLTVIEFYVRIYGYATEFELTSCKVSVKEKLLGKFGGEPLLLLDEEQQPAPPSFSVNYIPFEIQIPQVGNVTANTATVVFATTHMATSRIIYGLTPETMTNEVSSDEFEYYHSLVLINLQLEELYYCQIYAVSEITGEEIHSEVLSFFTGKEITIQNIFGDIDAEFSLKQKQELFVENVLSGTERLLTLEPDGIGDVSNDMLFSTHTKVELFANNIIGSDFDYSVTP